MRHKIKPNTVVEAVTHKGEVMWTGHIIRATTGIASGKKGYDVKSYHHGHIVFVYQYMVRIPDAS